MKNFILDKHQRLLQRRITSRKSDSRLHREPCALAYNMYNDNHTMNYGATKVLPSEKKLTEKVFIEIVYISKCDSCINKNQISTS